MSTETIYARVPVNVKDAAEAYASDHGLTLTAAVVDLLGRGLSAVSDEASVRELERQVAALSQENADLARELQEARGALSAVNERTKQTMATCPSCKKARITGHDLLVTGRCPECGSGLNSLLPGGEASSGLDQREFLMLLAALGVVLGVAYVATKS